MKCGCHLFCQVVRMQDSQMLNVTVIKTHQSLPVSKKRKTNKSIKSSVCTHSVRPRAVVVLPAHVQQFCLYSAHLDHNTTKHPSPCSSDALQGCTARAVACIRWPFLNTGWCALALQNREQSHCESVLGACCGI